MRYLLWQVVAPPVVGEAQGVLTAMKALTEGFGPLLVSSLLHVFEGSSLPGAPWLLCGASVGVAAVLSLRLESTIEAHAAASSPHVHSGGYDAFEFDITEARPEQIPRPALCGAHS